MLNHCMLDLETFGTKPGSVIRSIGAVMFDLDGRAGPEFYRNIDHKSCLGAGLVVDPNTEAWWKKQSKEAQDSFLVDPYLLSVVVADFHGWYMANHGRKVWAQGSNFDPPLWEAAATAVGARVPWSYNDALDTRTAYVIGNLNAFSVKREGTYHNALDDAKHQIRCVAKAIAMSKGALA